MDNFEYLNQISQSVRPTKKSRVSSAFPMKLIIFTVIGVVLFFILMIVGASLSNQTSSSTDLALELNLRVTNLNTTITTYNNSIKSSRLRSIGASLSSTLNNTATQLQGYFTTSGLESDDLTPKESIVEAETNSTMELDTALNNAKLNGLLDRVYLNQISYQVAMLMSLESQTAAKADEELLNIITQSMNSLSTVQDALLAFSDASS